ncbi:MAG: alpha/beta hydrolase [Bacteroidales bacterium]|nr:alpha/beta hydrolase [Bacteroidales bacterium]
MKSGFKKRILIIFLTFILFFCLLMLTPRFYSFLFPDKMPVGYHFVALDYLAVAVGLEDLINKSPEIPAEIEEIKNIEYKNIYGKSLQLDLYRLKGKSKPVPLIVFIHGGGWRGGERSDYLVYLIPFAKSGYVTATVSYRLLDDGPYPACVEDIKDAMQWFYDHGEEYGYDPDRIAVVGGSAGGHLAMLAAYGWNKKSVNNDSLMISESHRIKAVVDIYGPADLTTEYARNHTLVTSFLAKSYDESPEVYLEASPVNYLDKSDPPTLILQGTSDDLVPASQSVLLKERLDTLGVPAELYCLPLWPHTMDIVQRVNDFSRQKMDAFFRKYLDN